MRRSTTPKRHDRSQHPDVTKPGAHQNINQTWGRPVCVRWYGAKASKEGRGPQFASAFQNGRWTPTQRTELMAFPNFNNSKQGYGYG